MAIRSRMPTATGFLMPSSPPAAIPAARGWGLPSSAPSWPAMAARFGSSQPSKAPPSSCSFRRHKTLDPFDDDRGRHAAGGAHRHQAALEIAPLELVQHRADQDRAGGADGMAKRDRAAIDVDLVAIKL